MASMSPKPVVGDIWTSKSRKGYTVEVEEIDYRVKRNGARWAEVHYRTHTTPAKNPSPHSSVTTMPKFLAQFRKSYPELETL